MTQARISAMLNYVASRAVMIADQLIARGIKDQQVLTAMNEVPRERFVPVGSLAHAYDDSPLAVLAGQTISQPYIVALMLEALQLRGGERVLDVGTGSGYAAAVLSRIVAQVITVERIIKLHEFAQLRFSQLGYDNIVSYLADGSLGCTEHAPYDAILVSAAGPKIPPPLLAQLAIGGRLVMPVGPEHGIQTLWRETHSSADDYRHEQLAEVRFVPLLGEQGWRT